MMDIDHQKGELMNLRVFSCVLLVLFAQTSLSDTVRAKIVATIEGKAPGEETLLLAHDGRVYFVPPGEEIDTEQFELQEKSFSLQTEQSLSQSGHQNELFEISNFSDDYQLSQVFNQMNQRVNREAQCFDKAHFWSYEWKRLNQYKSGKAFLFFTFMEVTKRASET